MKQVIFICLLSISLCLSSPNGTPTDPPKHEEAPAPTEKTQAALANSSSPPNLPAQGAGLNPAPQDGVPNVPPPNQKSNATTENASPKDKDATTLAPATNVTEKPNPTTEKNPATPSSTVPTGPSTVTVPTPVSSSTKPTPTEPAHKATVPPKTPEPAPLQARGFDGASFVGGIILTLGLLAIGFMGFKYYKNQTERNYHTL